MVKVFPQDSETGFCSETTVYCLRCGVNIDEFLKYSKYSHNYESGCFVSLKIEVLLNFAFSITDNSLITAEPI